VTTPAAPPDADRRLTGLSFDAEGDAVPLAQERARRRRSLEDPFVGWTASLGITLVALFMRLWKVGKIGRASCRERV